MPSPAEKSPSWPQQHAAPASTYRWQFSGQLRFSAALELIDYLDRLGIDAVYSSPLFRARKESSHGYDVTDPNMIQPDFGTEAEFEQFAGELRRRGRGLIMDVVPNHMAIDDDNNVWWQDVLENGRSSLLGAFRKLAGIDHFENMRQVAMGFRLRRIHVEFGRRNSTPLRLLDAKRRAGAQAGKSFGQCCSIGACVQERSDSHSSTDT